VKEKTILGVRKVVNEFQKEEKSTAHRKGTFKIDKPFEETLLITHQPNNYLLGLSKI